MGESSEQAGRSGSPSNRKKTIESTATTGFAGAIVIGTMDWGLKCAAAGETLLPDNALVGLWVAFLLPVAHALGRAFMYQIHRLPGANNGEE